MARQRKKRASKADKANGANLGFESKLWAAADKLRGHMDAAVYKKQPTIGKLIDDAMVAIEKENPTLKGVLTKDYARPSLDKTRLGELIDLISGIGLGDEASRSKDILGRVYEYFLGRFAAAEGKSGGEFYTPQAVVKLLVEMIEPYKGRVFGPCCGSGGMFVQSEKFSWRTAAASATSPSTARSPTSPLGGWRR